MPLPFVTCRFLSIGVGILVADGPSIHFKPLPPLLRMPIHTGILAGTLHSTVLLASLA